MSSHTFSVLPSAGIPALLPRDLTDCCTERVLQPRTEIRATYSKSTHIPAGLCFSARSARHSSHRNLGDAKELTNLLIQFGALNFSVQTRTANHCAEHSMSLVAEIAPGNLQRSRWPGTERGGISHMKSCSCAPKKEDSDLELISQQ